jgi:hypothetical protein
LIVNVASTPENIAVLDVYGRQPDAAGNAVKLLSGVTEKIDAASDVLRTAIPIDPVGTTTLKSWIVADNIGKTTVLYIPSSVDSSTLVVLLNVDPKNADLLTIRTPWYSPSGFTNSSSSRDRDNHDFYRTEHVGRRDNHEIYRDQNTAYTFTRTDTYFHGNRRADGTDVSGVSAAPTNETSSRR